MAVVASSPTTHLRCDWRQRRRSQTAATAVPRPLASQQPAADSCCELGPGRRWMIVRGFVSEEERSQLFRKAILHMQRRELFPNPSGPNRFFAKTDDEPEVYVDPLLERMTRRCERCLRLGGVAHDLVLGRTISLILPGGFIHRHTDAYREGAPGHRPGYEHLRCNIVTRLADPSGRPVIDGYALPVKEGDLWVFFASKCPHSTEPIGGSDPRIVFGFGWSVPPSHALQPAPDGWREDGKR